MKSERTSKWKPIDQANFLLELGDLLENGFNLSDGIEFFMIHGSRKHNEELRKSISLLKEGHSFRDFLEWLGFHQELIGYVTYGEENGQLSDAMKTGGTIFLKKCKDQERLKNLFIYPLFLLIFSIALLELFSSFLFPKFKSMYADNATTQGNFYLEVAELLSSLIQLLPVITIALGLISYYVYNQYVRKLTPIRQEHLFQKIPILRRFRRLSLTYYFSVQLGSLLKSGLSISDALTTMNNQDPKKLIKEITGVCIKQLQEGDTLSDILFRIALFQEDLPPVVAHGQHNGLLGEKLFYFNRLQLAELESLTEKCLKIVQPLMFGLVALLIILLYLSILMPMISMMNSI